MSGPGKFVEYMCLHFPSGWPGKPPNGSKGSENLKVVTNPIAPFTLCMVQCISMRVCILFAQLPAVVHVAPHR